MEDNSKNSLLVGWASQSITPDRPVLLRGQLYERISQYVRDPLTATALALETVDEKGKTCDYSIMVSCDLALISKSLIQDIRERVEGKIQNFDVKKVFAFATHTHTGPMFEKGEDNKKQEVARYDESGKDVISPTECQDFLADKISETIVEAWNNRAPGGVNRAMEHATVGFCRMAMYRDGSARMYGDTNTADFQGLLSPSDPAVEMLFFKNSENKVTGVVVNVSCPSQVVEHMSFVSADFWSEARKEIRKNLGQDVFVLPITGAAGDQSPRDLTRLRRDSSPDTDAALNTYLNVTDPNEAGWEMYDERGLFIIGERIGTAVTKAYNRIKDEVPKRAILKHEVRELKLPMRRVTLEEYREQKKICEGILKKHNMDFDTENWYVKLPASAKEEIYISYAVVARFRLQQEKDFFNTEIHALRIGDSVLLTNPFELYIEYGMRMRARCTAKQVLLAQLACDSLGYLPTEEAVKRGGYSAIVASNKVGPEGGTLLVSRSVELANSLFE
jgi:hypothetical protein